MRRLSRAGQVGLGPPPPWFEYDRGMSEAYQAGPGPGRDPRDARVGNRAVGATEGRAGRMWQERRGRNRRGDVGARMVSHVAHATHRRRRLQAQAKEAQSHWVFGKEGPVLWGRVHGVWGKRRACQGIKAQLMKGT